MKTKDYTLYILAGLLIIAMFTSCSDKLCPAYASTRTHNTRR